MLRKFITRDLVAWHLRRWISAPGKPPGVRYRGTFLSAQIRKRPPGGIEPNGFFENERPFEIIHAGHGAIRRPELSPMHPLARAVAHRYSIIETEAEKNSTGAYLSGMMIERPGRSQTA